MAIIQALVAEGSFQLSSMCSVNVTGRMLHIFNLLDSDSYTDELVSRLVEAKDANCR